MAVVSDFGGYSTPLAQAPEGGAVATIASASGASPTRSVMLGVTTGVLVWFITRFLDGRFAPRHRQRR